jgi:retron-type reverse transcriptase
VLWLKGLNSRPDDGAFIVVGGVTTTQGAREGRVQGEGMQVLVKLILEAIYEPTFSNASHGFRPRRSCHTALEAVKKMPGIRWWVEGDIKGFFDHLGHETLVSILSKRIKDKRFLHLIGQFLRAGYVEDWHYHKTYSGAPQGEISAHFFRMCI